jgi:hypothetical protein
MRLFKCFVLCCFIVTIKSSFSQIYSANSYLTDFNGSMIKAGTNSGAMGSPFLLDEWCKGEITNAEGKRFEIERMKFNILQNRIEYEVKGNIYEPALIHQSFKIFQPVGDGTFITRSFQAGFPPMDGKDARTFYEVVYQGNSMMLKLHKIVVSEHAEPLSINRVLRFRQVSYLYFYRPDNQVLKVVSKKRDELPYLFEDKSKEMAEFIRQSEIKKNVSEVNLILLCKHYDSLF